MFVRKEQRQTGGTRTSKLSTMNTVQQAAAVHPDLADEVAALRGGGSRGESPDVQVSAARRASAEVGGPGGLQRREPQHYGITAAS